MNEQTVTEPIAIASLQDAESLRLGEQMLERAQAMSACDGIDAFAATRWLPDAFFDALEQLYAAYDAYIAHNIAASELKIQCKAACARCCRQHVYSTYAFEIVNL